VICEELKDGAVHRGWGHPQNERLVQSIEAGTEY